MTMMMTTTMMTMTGVLISLQSHNEVLLSQLHRSRTGLRRHQTRHLRPHSRMVRGLKGPHPAAQSRLHSRREQDRPSGPKGDEERCRRVCQGVRNALLRDIIHHGPADRCLLHESRSNHLRQAEERWDQGGERLGGGHGSEGQARCRKWGRWGWGRKRGTALFVTLCRSNRKPEFILSDILLVEHSNVRVRVNGAT